MTAQIVILILTVCLGLCVTGLIVSTAYFLGQWWKMDRILDHFWQEDAELQCIAPDNGSTCAKMPKVGRGSGTLWFKSVRMKIAGAGSKYLDLAETRESRVVSQLQRILDSTRYKEQQAVGEKNQIMELLSDLSHQLKTPLANIIMNMELLQDPALDEGQRKEFLDRTKSQADQMRWLMDNLLKASKLENGMIQFTAENTGIKETIAKAVGTVYAQASAKGIELSVEEFQDFKLYHNSKWTAEALVNILENGIKYSPADSSIRITLTKLDLYTKITVADEGIGIPAGEYNLIFTRFYRGKDVEQQEGSGLGLFLAQLIARHEKGYITVNSKVGQGSRFSLFLLNEME